MAKKPSTARLHSLQRPCHIFLTGQPSVGKTTLIKAIVDACTGSDGAAEHNDGDVLTCKQNIKLSGFYTMESRGIDGRRDGFDLVCFSDDKNKCLRGHGNVILATRTQLSRAKPKPTKGKPFVGKYLVDVENIDRIGVKSLQQVTDKLRQRSEEEESRIVCILDEVGKMEMLCPTFLPAVHGVLDAISERDKHVTKTNNACILLGTIPTPRYGHVIPAVEDIRSRGDVLVLHVSKSNRDELRSKLLSYFNSWIEGSGKDNDPRKDLAEHLYQRRIGSGSMNPTLKKGPKAMTLTKDTVCGDSKLDPCGPLVHSKIEPKVLLLGHTASPKPHNPLLAYCERSMWKILSHVYGTPHGPIQDTESATKTQTDNYQLLVSRVLQSSICIWDVLANVHVKGQVLRKGKRKSAGDTNITTNDLPSFLKKHKSIQIIAFIGSKAQAEFLRQFGKNCMKQLQCKGVTLPSSSPANSRLTVEEKSNQWKEAFEK